MRVENQPLHCIACKHEWMAEMLFDVAVEVWTAHIKTLHCPQCGAGARKVAFGRGDVPDPTPVQSDTLTDSERRAAWLKLHDSGLSACCIADKMCGLIPTGNYPHDGDDFGRCSRLLLLYPEWRARLGEMASVNKQWAALVLRWAEIEAAYRADDATWKSGKKKGPWVCYPLMRSILDSIA